MDLWPAYIRATQDALADADNRIAFDRFDVAQYLGKAVDQVRRQEHRQLLGQGDARMTGTKYQWLSKQGLAPQQRSFTALRKHLWGILNAVLLGMDNSHAESMNSRIKTVKTRPPGVRNKQHFRNAIYFDLGGLELYPDGIKA